MSWTASITRVQAKDAVAALKVAFANTQPYDPANQSQFDGTLVGADAKIAAVQPNPDGLVDIYCNGQPLTVVNRDPLPPPPTAL